MPPRGKQTIIVRTPPAGDPTRTISLRTRFAEDAVRRLKKLRRELIASIVDNDAFGFNQQPTTLREAGQSEWAYTWDQQKVEGFQRWLEEQEAAGILEVTQAPGAVGPEPWSNTYIRSAYQKGLSQGNSYLKSSGIIQAGELDVIQAFYQPFNVNRVGMLYTRSFDMLKGMTAAMNTDMSRVLAEGLAAGKGPSQIAQELAGRVDSIGIVRARRIARTEIVNAHNQGAMAEYEQAERLLGETVDVQWWTAEDERVRGKIGQSIRISHKARHKKVFSKAEAATLIGEPNCLLGNTVSFSPSKLERVFERRYEGPIIHIETANGEDITCTPNHPILTPSGFVPAQSLNLGDNVFRCSMADVAEAVGANKNDIVSSLKNKADAFALSGEISIAETIGSDFHGDGTDGQTAIILSDRNLKKNRSKIKWLQGLGKKLFAWARGMLPALDRFMCCLCLPAALEVCHPVPLDALGVASASGVDPLDSEAAQNSISAALILSGKSIDRKPPAEVSGDLGSVKSVAAQDGGNASQDKPTLHDFMRDAEFVSKALNCTVPFDVFRDQIVSIDVEHDFSGDVYNLQTESGAYIAQNVVVGNCRCSLLPWLPEFAEAAA